MLHGDKMGPNAKFMNPCDMMTAKFYLVMRELDDQTTVVVALHKKGALGLRARIPAAVLPYKRFLQGFSNKKCWRSAILPVDEDKNNWTLFVGQTQRAGGEWIEKPLQFPMDILRDDETQTEQWIFTNLHRKRDRQLLATQMSTQVDPAVLARLLANLLHRQD